MKKELLLAFFALFSMSLTALTGAYANEKSEAVLYKDKIDLTGDGLPERLLVTGVPSTWKDSYFKDLKAKIISERPHKTFTINLGNGISPSVSYPDFNRDKAMDLSIQTSSGSNNPLLYSLKDGILTEYDFPEPLKIKGSYEDHYKASVKIVQTGNTFTISLAGRKNYYDSMGIYNNQGLAAFQPTPGAGRFVSLEPAVLKGDKDGLKGLQQIEGISSADMIGVLESGWVFVNGHWQLAYADVIGDEE